MTLTQTPYDLVRAVARADGDRAALVDPAGAGTQLSYSELIDRAEALARRLREHGVAAEQPVAVVLERGADTVVAMLAVLAAGGVYCPLDVAAPDARLTAVVELLGAKVALTDAANAGRLPGGVDALRLDVAADASGASDAADASGGSGAVGASDASDAAGIAAFEPATPTPDSLAYVLYTSGSTGVPKGVAMTHRGLSRLIGWQIASGAPGLRTLQFTATSFDVTFQEVLSTLATGGCLVVAAEQVRRDPALLLETIVKERVQRLFLPYVALQLMAVTAARLAIVPETLEHVVTAGERLVVTPAIRDLFAALPHCRLDNHYGPTEAHLVTSQTLPADRAAWPDVPGIGAPVAGVACHVLDERLRAVPEGEVGELYVSGPCLARGYLADPARTAERFVADPSDGASGERWYRTGDLVRLVADGTYEFLGRADGQLKVRGFRVEPGEVETALASHPRVHAAAVGLRQIEDGISVLVGYLQTDGALAQREIGDHVRALLPAYMVPSRFIAVAELPRTGTGKVDTRSLAEIELPEASEAVEALEAFEAVETAESDQLPLADIVTALWTRVLGHAEFEPDDDFFDVGGDSLLATWVAAELGQLLGRPVELSLFLEYSTVEDLAEALGSQGSATVPATGPASASQIVTLRPGPSGRSLYLFHPLGGELICYRELARASRAPVRVLGVGWSGTPPQYGAALEDIARAHVEQLLVIQPDTPFLLAGWSFGGVLAFEVARQLTEAGASVDFLGLIDANPVIDPITGLPLADTPFLGVLDEVVALLDAPETTPADLTALTSGDTWLQLMGAPIAPGASSTYLRTALDTARACMWAAMRYQARRYDGPIDVFQASGSGPERQEALAGAIRSLAGGAYRAVAVPGGHWACIRAEDGAETARALDAALERVGAAGSGTHGS